MIRARQALHLRLLELVLEPFRERGQNRLIGRHASDDLLSIAVLLGPFIGPVLVENVFRTTEPWSPGVSLTRLLCLALRDFDLFPQQRLDGIAKPHDRQVEIEAKPVREALFPLEPEQLRRALARKLAQLADAPHQVRIADESV